ncbi:LysM peptidoglycan-binding domain-containing protein [Thalassobacillus sp. C254]|uniref:LysM peptidoglycan-binding domain-containing protein n=1 Tax=Thalassobacillus sp. C254 TaxID=1225341 RepID=UPI0006D23B61|nr:LysM peptidoglycan-binding domain-containing protein [Thalassobacillus sp. C254]
MKKTSVVLVPIFAAGAVFGASGLTAGATTTSSTTVEHGDTFWSIAQEHNMTNQEVMDLNQGLDPYYLLPGTEVMLETDDGAGDFDGVETHTVEKGETFYSIAQQYDGVTADELNNINHGLDPDAIPVGTEILLERVDDPGYVDGPFTHRIEEGETFYSIAQQYEGVTVDDLKEENPYSDPNKLTIGATIGIPE